MFIYKKPKNLNGAELIAELKNAGLEVKDIYDYADGTIGFDANDEATAAAVVEAHNGNTIPPEPTVADKLANVGLSIDDLKSALGL
jgi:hypothetical protein